MKKIFLTVATAFLSNVCNAQEIKKDTVMLDGNQVEKINKMPMDTMHHNMPIVPLNSKDSVINRKSPDDMDPKKPETPK